MRLGVETLLAVLDDERRAAFVLTQLIGLSYEETAEAMGCPIGTVRSRLFRARRLLQEALVEHARDLGLVPATDPEADEEV